MPGAPARPHQQLRPGPARPVEQFRRAISLPFEARENMRVTANNVDDRGIEPLRTVALEG